MKIQELLRDCRRKKNFSVRKMANYLEVDHAMLYRWETGTQKPMLTSLLPLSEKLGISMQDMVNAWLADQNVKSKKTAL